MATGLGVDIHPVYQAGANALPGVEYGWIKMADGAAVYRKTVNGVTYTADAHAALFRRLGIPFGGYEFAELGTDGAKAFDVLWAECLRLGATGVAPGVDIEGAGWNATNAAARGKAFCDRARARGVRPAVYMDLSLLQATRPDLWSSNPVIWAPRYGAKPEAGGRYTGRYDVHQYSSSGALPGSAGLVDWNQAYTNAHLLGAAPNGEEPDMDANQSRALYEVLEQLVGTRDLDKYPGWDKQPPKDFAKATLVDFIRQTHAELKALQVAFGQAATPTIDYAKLAAALPPEMADDIAERVAVKLAARLAQ